jgi:hypothetical protein
MELLCWDGPLRWTIVGHTKSTKRRMKRRDARIERLVVYAELFREESVLVVILANFPTMKKELQILVGVMKRIEVPSGIMTRIERVVVFAELFREESVLVVILVNFHMMKKYVSE